MEISCAKCGAAVRGRPYVAAGQRYCSTECKQSDTRVNLTCPQCGGPFWEWRSQMAARGANPYCSKACVDTAKRKTRPPPRLRPPVLKVCETCSVTFRIPPARRNKARFCSRNCRDSNAAFRQRASEIQQREKHWRWGGGRYQRGTGYVRIKGRKNAVETGRAEHRAVMLTWLQEESPDHPFLVTVDGARRLHPDVDVHHIDRDRANNARSNLLAVTKPAHAQIHHRGTKPNAWECWPPDPATW